MKSLLSLPDELLVTILEHLVPPFAQPGPDWENTDSDLKNFRSMQLVNTRVQRIAYPITWRAVHLYGPDEDEDELVTARIYNPSGSTNWSKLSSGPFRRKSLQ